MAHLGTLRGSGTLRWLDGSGSVTYLIDVYSGYEIQLRTAEGIIVGNDDLLIAARHASRRELVLESGDAIAVTIVRHSVGTGRASILADGPVPEPSVVTP